MGERAQTLRSSSLRIVALMVLGLGSAPLISNTLQSFATDLEGKPFDPFRAARGKVAVMIFVRTDCPISNRYAPAIQQLSARNGGKAVFFLVYPGKKDTANSIRKHDREFGYTLAALRDPQHILVKQSQAQITPEAAVFQPQPPLRYHHRVFKLYQEFCHARKRGATHQLGDAHQTAPPGKKLQNDATPAGGPHHPGP